MTTNNDNNDGKGGRVLTDRDLLQAAQTFLGRTRANVPPPAADTHGMIQEFGVGGFPLVVGSLVILVVTKPCVLNEWSLDSTLPGFVTLKIEWSDWRVPRVWQDIVGPAGMPPGLAGTSNWNSADLSNWSGPLRLNRRDGLRLTVMEATDIEQITLVLYMKELGPSRVQPQVVS